MYWVYLGQNMWASQQILCSTYLLHIGNVSSADWHFQKKKVMKYWVCSSCKYFPVGSVAKGKRRRFLLQNDLMISLTFSHVLSHLTNCVENH